MITCIRPSRGIYSSRLQHMLTPKEMWLCQGLFPHSLPNPDAVHAVLKQTGKAPDFAGNAMSRTVQAHVLAAFVHAHAESCMGAPATRSPGQPGNAPPAKWNLQLGGWGGNSSDAAGITGSKP